MFFQFSLSFRLDHEQYAALELVARSAGLPDDATVVVGDSQRSDQVTVLSLRPEEGYPGVAPALAFYQGQIYAAALGRGLDALAAALGWFDSPPTAAAAFELYALVEHAGGLFLDSGARPELTVGRGQLLLRAKARAPFDNVARWHEVELRPHQRVAVRVAALANPPPAILPIDAVTRWIRSADAGDLDAVASVRALTTSADPRARAAVIAASARPEEAIWVEALSGLDPNEPAVATALAGAWSTLSAAAFAERVSVVRELFGSVPSAFLGASVGES